MSLPSGTPWFVCRVIWYLEYHLPRPIYWFIMRIFGKPCTAYGMRCWKFGYNAACWDKTDWCVLFGDENTPYVPR